MDILDQALLLDTASQRLSRAQAAMAEDKSHHRSLFDRLHDAVAQTDAEEEFEQAQAHLQEVEDRLLKTAPHWIESTINQEIAASQSPEGRALEALRPLVLRTHQRAASSKNLARLAAIAVAELEDAIAQCSRASSTELTGAFSSLPMSRDFSDHESKEATHSINKARSALARLGEEMDTITAAGVEEAEQQWWLRVINIQVPKFAGAAISVLDRAQEQCKEALGQARELQRQLTLVSQRQSAEWERSLAEYQKQEAPFRAAAMARVPATLAQWLQKKDVMPGEWDGLAPRSWLIDLGALDRARA